MNELPKSWCIVEIERVLKPLDNGKVIQQGWSPQCEKQPASPEEWGVLKTTAIQEGYFIPEENKKLPFPLEPRPAIEVKSGDILMTCAGPRNRCGITSFVKETHTRLMMSGKMYRFRADPQKVMPSYLEAFLLSQEAKVAIDRMKTGINDSGLNLTHSRFLKLPVPVAPLNEQKRIVAKIEELLSELDKGIESLKTAREQLKVYRQVVLKHAFEGKLTADFRHGKPPAWATLSVSQLLNQPLCNGRSVKDRIGGFPVLRLTALKGGRIDLAESKEGDWNREDALPVLVSSGDFFVARGNGSKHLVGMGGLVPEVTKEVAFPDTMIRLRLKTACVDPRYFALCWNSRIVRQQIERDARTTAGIYKINQDHISRFTLPVPRIEEQRVIVSRVEEKLSEAESAIEQLSNDLQRGAALRQSILKKAFSGKLVAQDPNDEPASVLLERIRAEKETQSSKKKSNQKQEAGNLFKLAAIQTEVVQTSFWQ